MSKQKRNTSALLVVEPQVEAVAVDDAPQEMLIPFIIRTQCALEVAVASNAGEEGHNTSSGTDTAL